MRSRVTPGVSSTIDKRFPISLLNKVDLQSKISEQDERLKNASKIIIKISALNKTGIEDLYEKISEMFDLNEINFDNDLLITNIRHKTSLQEALRSLQLVLQSIADEMPEDFYSIDLMNAYQELGNIIGESVEDDLVNEIFSKFCMGK